MSRFRAGPLAKSASTAGAAIAAVLWLVMVGGPAAAQSLPDDLVFLRDLDPSIQQDIRYAGVNNFMGRRLDG